MQKLLKFMLVLASVIFVASVLITPAFSSEYDKPIWHSNLIICTTTKTTPRYCMPFASNAGPATYDGCIKKGLEFKEFFRSSEFQRNPTGLYEVLHYCENVETKDPDEASIWTDTLQVAPSL